MHEGRTTGETTIKSNRSGITIGHHREWGTRTVEEIQHSD